MGPDRTSSTPGLPSRSWDQTELTTLVDLFLVRFFFNFWLHISFLLTGR